MRVFYLYYFRRLALYHNTINLSIVSGKIIKQFFFKKLLTNKSNYDIIYIERRTENLNKIFGGIKNGKCKTCSLNT